MNASLVSWRHTDQILYRDTKGKLSHDHHRYFLGCRTMDCMLKMPCKGADVSSIAVVWSQNFYSCSHSALALSIIRTHFGGCLQIDCAVCAFFSAW